MSADKNQTRREETEKLEERVIAALHDMTPADSARWVWRIIGLLVLAAGLTLGVAKMWPAGGGGAAVAGAEPAQKQQYTCGMHPDIVEDEPGTCPICGMNLTPIRQNNKKKKKKQIKGETACKGREIIHYQAPMDPNYTSPAPGKSPMGMDLVPVCESDEMEVEGGVSIDSRVRQNMGIRTDLVRNVRLRKTIRAVGHVDYDERRIALITTKIDGWIEGLSVDFTGQAVKKGDTLFAMYSPQLVSTQEELVSARRAWNMTKSGRDLNILKSARKRLEYWDISKAQIERIENTGKTERTMIIEAPQDGVVIHKTAFEGKFVKAGTELFRIADLSRVWIYAHLYEMDAPFVKVGDLATVRVPFDGGPDLSGRVDFVFPWLSEKTREVKARVVFNNPNGRLKPAMYVDVNMVSDLGIDGLVVDDSAVIRTGTRNVVFVEIELGTYEPRVVVLGRDLDGTIEIIKGLKEGEKVVIKGQFMLDSESRLKEALTKYEMETEGHDHGDAVVALETLLEKGCTYTCPMPEHFHVCGNAAEPDPECGMTMKPVKDLLVEHRAKAEKDGVVKTPAGQLQKLADDGCEYTCTMESDFDVCGKEPGKCPKCGMNLVPLKQMQDKHPMQGDHAGHAHAKATELTPLAKLEALEAKSCTHTCPMESHFHICGEKAGECPECGMTLRPISSLKADLQPKGTGKNP